MNTAKLVYDSLIVNDRAEEDENSKVMIVDDEAYNCEVLKSMVLGSGVEPSRIITCISGK